ncbi:hypothetical protein HYPSUDRAFT_175241 [Hypholoma sublateritium FD-334 SS-4]|uniref:DNA replication factor Cdt1 C-terminal domain-containing protein n=1 Tax=Hypholoma sublateritium (strain FD-334 SS-4) TaxID=945553 RepID=A0A0D2PGV9_HYPSF|nr:hypothetical protein HYPSUDRAFT_175241 [Hypholoma sublateritium FD-334 SS-4]
MSLHMSDLYTTLRLSPKKKRSPSELDDGNTLTPKKLRLIPPTPPPSSSKLTKQSLPASLARLSNIQTALQHALSHALATCAISPTSDSGIVRNVLNHISLTTYSGFTTSFELDDLKRLCWLWEWDGEQLDSEKVKQKVAADEEENPFMTKSSSSMPAEWTRGSMGIILSPATHFSKRDRKRVPAYGIGIEVEMDIDKDMGPGMAAVARWTATGEKRRAAFVKKLERWAERHPDGQVPQIPLADIPELSVPKMSTLTRTLASASPSSISSIKLPGPPSSPSRSPVKRPARDFAIPFPTVSRPVSPFKKSTILFPQTPSRHNRNSDLSDGPPHTPSSTSSSPAKDVSEPSTPVHQRGNNETPLQTPTTSRRDALYERIRQRSLSMSPTKTPRKESLGSPSKMTRDQMLKMSQDELRRRCLLGRLGGVAESIWMLFSNPATGGSSTPARKRRALPTADVVTAIVKSSPVPISTAEANESISMLTKLCPFFLKKLNISGGEWLEMPAPTPSNLDGPSDGSPTKGKQVMPTSPGRLRGKEESAQELLSRSPRRIKRETGGLREVREIIRRELELND